MSGTRGAGGRTGRAPRLRVGRRLALPIGLLGVLLPAGCGVQPSGVIQAGAPATGMPPGASLYFVAGDRLQPVPRGARASDVGAAVELLFQGPPEEEAGKLRSELPEVAGPPAVAPTRDGFRVVLKSAPLPLSPLAMSQLACTIAAAWTASGARATSQPATARPDAATPTAATPGAPARSGAHPVPVAPPRIAGEIRVEVVGTGWTQDLTSANCPAVPTG